MCYCLACSFLFSAFVHATWLSHSIQLKLAPPINFGLTQEKHSALMFATLDGRLEIVKLLIVRKADVNHRNKVAKQCPSSIYVINANRAKPTCSTAIQH